MRSGPVPEQASPKAQEPKVKHDFFKLFIFDTVLKKVRSLNRVGDFCCTESCLVFTLSCL